MQVRAGCAACLAHQGNDLPFLYLVPNGDAVFGIMCVTRRITISMVNLDHDAVAITVSRPGYDAVGNRNDIVTVLTGKINTRVVGGLASERVGTLAKIRRQPA